ncbi:hypothetical protein [Mycolicibacterium wolinskyi]|uniref:hypothetical protein n=1 Tax=Mycolicibacterium wolinskyi TaxID=59750 RepID=UPI003BACFC94
MEIGDEWIYRLRTYSPTERVRILGIEKRKQSVRVDIEFLDGNDAGRHENVPGSRLHGPWSTLAAFDERWANWQRLDGDGLDDVEQRAVLMVLIALIPEEIVMYDNSPARHGVTVSDTAALEKLMKRPMSDVLGQVDWFECDGDIELSSYGTLLIAEYVCAANPVPLLEAVMAEEAEAREHCKRGCERDFFDGSGKQMSSPEREFFVYRKYVRPKHELVRAWCGHRSVSFVERLEAAEGEVRRLDVLVAELIDVVREHNTFSAQAFEIRHNDDRIRPETVRPLIDRPLAPWEIPVKEIRVRGRRW